MRDSRSLHGFLGKQAIDYLLGKIAVDAEYGLGSGILNQAHGLTGLRVKRIRHPAGVQNHLDRAHEHATDKGNSKYPAEYAVSQAMF
jgi:hypothetical protein